ncbi:hypothetical protein C7G41_33085 [Bradyrhizobium sp. MOS002]|nr:hypothetical protein C7G41_33085 [Bradyrhizobium sp. MOS002]
MRRRAISLESGHLKAVLHEYIATMKLQPCEVTAGYRFDQSEATRKALVGYIASLKASGSGLPSRNGRPNMAAIARGAEICVDTLLKVTHRNHTLIKEEFELMGPATEAPKREAGLVLSELLEELSSDRREVRPYRKSLTQLRSAAIFASSRHSLADEAPAVEALTDARDAAERADLKSRLSSLIAIATNIESNGIIPESFADAIAFGCRRANIQLHDLVRPQDEDDRERRHPKRPCIGWKLHDWVRGRSVPDRFTSFGDVMALEDSLEFDRGTLWTRVRFRSCALGTIPKSYWPEEIPQDPVIKKEVKFYLPDEILTLPPSERHELMMTAYGVVMIKRAKHVDENHIANCADRYRHKAPAWSPMLAEDMDGLIAFHSFKPDIDDESEDNDTLWVKGTQERSLTYVEKTMGALLRTRPTFRAEDLTLALFAIPQVGKDTIEFARSRRSPKSFELHPEPIKPYSAEDIQLCVFAKMMLAEGGFLRQRPEFFEKLNADAREMLAVKFKQAPDNWAEICAAGDWTAICTAAEAYYAARIKKIDKWITEVGPQLSRPKERIFEVLDGDLHDFRAAFGNILKNRLAKCEPGYRAWAYAVQNVVYHEMIAQFPHRSRAIVETTYAPDRSGTVRYVDGTWYWYVHWTSVKNGRRNGLFKNKQWFVGKLKDTNGLYDALDQYTSVDGARDWILGGRASTSFFVTSSDKPELNANKLYAKVASSTLFILSQIADERWSTTRCYGAHAERKIGFNSVLEEVSSPGYEASFLKACGMLLITPKVAEDHYLFAPPEELAAGVGDKLDRERRERQAPHSLR